MLTIEKRVAALETAASDDTIKLIIVEDGETQAEALKRAGLRPDALGVMYGTPLDVKI